MMRFDHRPLQELASPFLRRDGVSLHEVVVDALARILLETDGALTLLDEEEASRFLWLEPHLRTVFDEINSVMFRLTE
jgi:hypothetical protein